MGGTAQFGLKTSSDCQFGFVDSGVFGLRHLAPESGNWKFGRIELARELKLALLSSLTVFSIASSSQPQQRTGLVLQARFELALVNCWTRGIRHRQPSQPHSIHVMYYYVHIGTSWPGIVMSHFGLGSYGRA